MKYTSGLCPLFRPLAVSATGCVRHNKHMEAHRDFQVSMDNNRFWHEHNLFCFVFPIKNISEHFFGLKIICWWSSFQWKFYTRTSRRWPSLLSAETPVCNRYECWTEVIESQLHGDCPLFTSSSDSQTKCYTLSTACTLFGDLNDCLLVLIDSVNGKASGIYKTDW